MGEAELLAAIYATPDDDEPRLVYMDWLADRGDPRAELIGLQLARHRSSSKQLSRKDERRERELVATHLESWLGEAAPLFARPWSPVPAAVARAVAWMADERAQKERGWPSPPTFERGFLASATVLYDRAQLRTLGIEHLAEHPSLATLVELAGEIEAIACDQLPALRRIRPRPHGTAGEMLAWMDLLERLPHLEMVGGKRLGFVRRDGRLLLRVYAGWQFDRDERFDRLAERAHRGWTIELVSWRDEDPAHHVQAQRFYELEGFEVTTTVAERPD